MLQSIKRVGISSKKRNVASICFVIAIISSIFFFVFPPSFAIRSLYALFGAILALAIYKPHRNKLNRAIPILKPKNCIKLEFVLVSGIIITSVYIGRIVPVFVIYPIALVLLFIQVGKVRPITLVTQGSILMTAYGLTKYISNGFYFGIGDSFGHISYISHWLTTGSPPSNVYGQYPGYHLISTTLSYISKLPPYESAIVTVLIFNAILIPSAYLAAVRLGISKKRSIIISISMCFLPQMLFNNTFMHSQSVAAVLVILILSQMFSYNRATVLFLLIIALLITHHLTPLVLIIGVVGWFLLSYISQPFLIKKSEVADFNQILVLITCAISYWIYQGEQFFTTISYVWGKIIQDGFILLSGGDEASVSRLILFGVENTRETTATAIIWLISFEGVFYTILFCLCILGAITILHTRDPVKISLAAISSIGLLAIFPMPFSLKLLGRFSIIFSIGIALIVGYGLAELMRSRDTPIKEGSVLLLIFLLGIGVSVSPAATVTPADDLDSNFEADFANNLLSIDGNHAYSNSEVSQSRSTATFLNNFSPGSSTFWTQKSFLELFNASPSSTRINGSEIYINRSFIYTSSWSNEREAVSRDTAYIRTVVFSQKCLNNLESTNNKAYTTGELGIIYPNGPTTSFCGDLVNDRSIS